MDATMTSADAGAPLTHGEGECVPFAYRGLQWVAQQLAPSVEDGELAGLRAEYRWKWFAGGDSESREDFVFDVNDRLQRHLAGNMPGWCAAMTSSAKVVGLYEQVARALYGNRGDLSELKARAAFHRTQTKEQCVDCDNNLEMYTSDWMLDFINEQILLLLEANDVDSLADKDFTDPVNEYIPPGLLPPPPLDYASLVDSDPDMSGLSVTSDAEGAGGVTPQGIAHKKATPPSATPTDTDEAASQASTTELVGQPQASRSATNEEVHRFISSIHVDSDEINAARAASTSNHYEVLSGFGLEPNALNLARFAAIKRVTATKLRAGERLSDVTVRGWVALAKATSLVDKDEPIDAHDLEFWRKLITARYSPTQEGTASPYAGA